MFYSIFERMQLTAVYMKGRGKDDTFDAIRIYLSFRENRVISLGYIHVTARIKIRKILSHKEGNVVSTFRSTEINFDRF